MNPPPQFFQTVEGKAPKEAWGGHLGSKGMYYVSFIGLRLTKQA